MRRAVGDNPTSTWVNGQPYQWSNSTNSWDKVEQDPESVYRFESVAILTDEEWRRAMRSTELTKSLHSRLLDKLYREHGVLRTMEDRDITMSVTVGKYLPFNGLFLRAAKAGDQVTAVRVTVVCTNEIPEF